MVINGRWQSRPVTISVKPNCLTVSVDGPLEASVFSYDYAGRMWTALLDGISYRRGLDGKIIAKWQIAGRERNRRWLTADETRQVEERARSTTAGLYAAITEGHAELLSPLPEEGRLVFERAIAFDAAKSAADAVQYHQVYRPVGILPPDQYMAVVLQATEGCSFNTCNFCTFYKDRPFRIRRPAEFRLHALAVRDFLGAGLSLRRTIFLGDANALVIPMPILLPLMDVVHEVYDVASLGGIYAFLDGFSGDRKSVSDYRALAARGLKRVYIGMESGNEELLKFLQKPSRPVEVVRAVKSMKAAGVAVGIIVLLGAGGHQYAAGHVNDTISAINAMPLDMDDIVYFSELIVDEGMDYARAAFQANLSPLTSEERIAQGQLIEAGLRFSEQGGTPHISRYDIREFVY
ncbi:MAG: radical SAM protein [Chloroflexi bacterium]|nr:radical SAM protein [Chloroflexota bacterium]